MGPEPLESLEPSEAVFGGSLAETPLPQVLRRIFLGGLKGTLTLVRKDEVRNLFFEKGELRTAVSSREAQRIGAFLTRRGWITEQDLAWTLETVARQGRARLGRILIERGLVTRAVLDTEMRRLIEEIVFSTFDWGQGAFRFQPSTGVLDPDVALSLPTAAIIVEGIRRLPESEAFLVRLGGVERVPILARDPVSRFQYLSLTPYEAYLLSRVDGVTDVESLLKIAGPPRAAAAKTLYALVSCGILEWKREGARATPNVGLERLNVEVAERPAARSPGQAEMVRNTYRRIDWLTHYELLGVAADATPEEIREAYFERTRVFHPDLRYRDDLASLEKELAAVFSRLETAYETLSHPVSRQAYDAGLSLPVRVKIETAGDAEAVKELARRSYLRAQQLIGEKDFHPAVEMLREALHFVPDSAEYRFALGQIEMKNEKWIERGLDNLKTAARLDPRREEYLLEAARQLNEHGRSDEALPFVRRALQLNASAENQALLNRILAQPERLEKVETAAESSSEAPGLLPALRRLFRRRS